MDEQDEILTVNEAAQLLKVNPQVIRKWALAGTIPAGRLGDRRWRFSRKALIEWLFERGVGRRKGAREVSERERHAASERMRGYHAARRARNESTKTARNQPPKVGQKKASRKSRGAPRARTTRDS